MKNKYRFWFLALLTVVLMVGFFVSTREHSFAATGTNQRINFQGKVVNTNGTNVANGSYSFVFSIYTVSSGGSNVWTETKSLTVTDGIFQTDLGDTTALPGSIDFNTDNIYLGINFNSDGEMTPRVRFDAVPQAFNAQKVAGLTVTDTTGTLTIPNGKTISFADAFSTSGAFPLTLTSTASTTATLPSGTITLVDLAASQTLTNKTIGSTGLVFSGATTDVDTAAAEGLSLQGRAASSFATTAGDITLQPAGSGTIASVQIGAGGAGSTTPDFLGLDVKSSTGDPAGGYEGAMYYNTFDNKFRCYEGAAWVDCIGAAGGSSTLQTAYDADADGGNATVSLTAADDGLIFTNPTSGGTDLSAFLAYFNQQNTTAAVSALDITQASNASNAVNITANAIDGENGLAITTNGLTSGAAINVASSSAALTGALEYITLTGSNVANTGSLLALDNTGTANANTSLYVKHYATGTGNLAFRVDDVSGDTTPVVIDGDGNLGVGDATPASLLTVGNGDLFQVNSSGAIAAAAGITSSGTITFSGLSTAGIVTNTAAGVLGTTATVPAANGGFGINTSASTGVPTVSAGVWSVATTLAVNRGGTNAAAVGSAGSIAYSTGTAYAFSGVGTAGQALVSGGTGAPTFFAPTAGSLIFAGTGGILQQDNANFFWDDTNNRLGIGTTSPAAPVSIFGTNNALRLSYDTLNYATVSALSNGDISLGSSNATEAAAVIGNGSAVSASVQFDGATQDYYAGLDNADSSFKIGSGLTVGTSPLFTITSAGNIGVGDTTPASLFTVGNGDLFQVNSSGAIVSVAGIASSQTTLVVNATGNVDVQDALNADSFSTDTGGISIAAGQSYTGTGAVTLSSGSATGLTLNAGNNTLTIDSSDTALTASGVATFTVAANASLTNASGNLILQPAGSGTIASVQIGAGGAGSITPDFLGLDVKSDTGDPVGGYEGAMYYNTFDNKFRCYQGAAWADCIGAGGGSVTVRETDGTPSVTGLTALEFGPVTTSSDEFVVTDQTGGVARVTIGSQVGMLNQAETVTGGWTFNTAATTFTTIANANGGLSTSAGTALGLSSGNNGAGAAGNITLDVGTSTTGNGSILIGTAARTQTITIGNSTGGVITVGATSGSGLVLQDAQWGVTDAGAASFATVNGLTITNNGTNTLNVGTGLTLAVSTANKTLAGAGTSLSIANALTFGAGTTGSITLGSTTNTLTLATTGNTSVTLPVAGTLLTNSSTVGQTMVSTQTSGTGFALSDATNITAALIGQSITLSGTGAFDQTGLQFNLSGATGTNLNDIVGTGSTWKVSRAGTGTFASVTSPTYTSAAGLTINSGNNTVTIDATDTALSATGLATLTFAPNTTLTNASGNLILQPGGVGTIASVQIGAGGAGSTTPDFLGLDVKSSTGDPAGGYEGAMYYNTFDNKFRCYEGAGWKDCDTSSAGGGYATIADEGGSLTQRATLNFTGTGVTCVDNSGSSRTDCTISSAGGGVSFASGTPDNTTGTNALIQLQKNGADKFVVANNGGVSVFGSTTNITKTNTGTTGANDFSITGSTLTNVTSQNDEIDIDAGNVVTTFTSAAAATAVAVGAGGHSIVRDDGKVLVIHGGGAATGSLWDGVSGTMTSVTVATGATLPGAGAISLKRPDGKYLLIHGNASAGLTSIYDPWGVAAVAAGPAICGGGAAAADAGTNAFMRPDGKYVILCGTRTSWGIYDPTANTYTAGTVVATAFNVGAHAVARDDGTFLVFAGGGTTVHYVYTPSGTAATAGVMSAASPITANAPTISAGAFSIRRNDGRYLVVGGAIDTSTLYNPTPTSANSGAGSFELINGGTPAAGFGPITTALGDAAQAVRRQDGKYLMVHGGASTLTDIIDPSVTTSSMFTAGTALNNAMGAGGHFVPRPDGKYAIVRGGAGTSVDTYDMGFVVGGNGSGSQLASYETECITVTSLNQSSTLNWNANTEGTLSFQVKTGASTCSGAYKDMPANGGLINPTAGDDRVQVKVFFKRGFFIGYDQEWALWKGLSQPRYRAKIADPTLYDITIDNSTQLHRTAFDYGIGASNTATDPSGPVASNINILADKSAQLSTGGGNLSTTVSGTGNQNNGAFGTHTALATAAAEGTIVMKRPNGTFMVIAGSLTTANAQIYDQNAQTFTANANGVSGSTCSGNCTPASFATKGALAFKRPDGKFLIVLGGATTTTSIYDPVASTFTAGPVLTATAGRGALTIPLPNGRVLIIHGNLTATTSIYDPVQNVMIAGPNTATVVGAGALVIPNADGTWLLAPGMNHDASPYVCIAPVTTTNYFDPYAMTFTVTATSPILTNGLGPGAFTFQRSDGMWIIIKGGATVTTCAGLTSTNIYNPFTKRMGVGPTLAVGSQQGAHAVQRPNGSWLIFNGTGLTTTQIYVEKDGTAAAGAAIGSFIAGPATTSAIGTGAVSFQRDDGKYVTISGGTGTTATAIGTANTNVQQYDAAWVATGAYRTEQLNISDLSTDSTLSWKASPDMKNISAEVRTAASQLGLQTASSRDVTTSGGLINPGGSDTWVQVQFNFKRTFPTNGNIWSDVWWNGGSSSAYAWRTIANPTLNEFKINKDVNLMNLKADGLSVFRVSTNGDVYLSANGAVRSGGADLAENYTSTTMLEPGEVVSIDPLSTHGIKRSQYQYQKDMLGVVSTAPGFVAGSHTEDSYPVALVGRVPVKVSTENGSIKVGDHLTAASVPGYAMRATKAGRVLGVALQTLDETKLSDCPASAFASTGRKCGEIEMFVNLVNYLGDSVQMAMEERAQVKNLSGEGVDGLSAVSDDAANTSTSGLSNDQSTISILDATGEADQFSKQQQILGFLQELKAEQAQSSQYSSEIFADQISATNGIITPQIVTDLLIAKRIKADSIEGLAIFTDSISSLSERVASQDKDIRTQLFAALNGNLGDLDVQSARVSMSMSVDGKLTVNGLTVNDIATFNNDTFFNKLASFIGKVVFKNDVAFEKAPVFNKDTAGFARIVKGSDRVDIVFDTAYEKTPIIQAMMNFEGDKSDEITDETAVVPAVALSKAAEQKAKKESVAREALQKQLLEKNYSYFVVNRSKKGFTIMLNKVADQDLDFSWVAIAVAEAKTFESKKAGSGEDAQGSASSQAPSEQAPPVSGATPSALPEATVMPRTEETLTLPQSNETSSGATPPQGTQTPEGASLQTTEALIIPVTAPAL